MAFLVLDAGTGSGKCLVFDRHGRLLGAHGERWSYQIRAQEQLPVIKEYSFDPEEFWSILCRCARAALAQSGVAASDIEGVATTSQREGCVFLGHDGQPLYAGPNIDARGYQEGIEVLQTLGAAELYRITGHSAPFIFPLARYLWYRKRAAPPVAQLLMINDWMTYRLCGTMAAEPSNATESMFFDLAQRRWSNEILATFQIPAEILPPVLPSGSRVGSVHAEAAAATGLTVGTPVFMGGADTQCSLLGSGLVEPDGVAATFGTTTPVQAVTAAPTFDPQGNLWVGCHVVPERWVLESNAGDTGNALLWLLEMIGGGASLEQCFRWIDELANTPPVSATLMFIGPTVFNVGRMNFLRPGGVLFPFPSLHVRPDRGALLRSFVENVGYAIRGNLEQLAGVTGYRSPELKVSGGMTRSAGLLQSIANVTGLPLQVASEPESAALGAAILIAAAGESGQVANVAAAMVRHRTIFPDLDQHDHYERAYAKWRELDELLDGANIAI